MAVLVAHTLLHPLPYIDYDLQRLGTFGVILFFVVSGFVMVFISGRDSFNAVDFIQRRLERIVPLYWLATFLVAVIAIVAPFVLKETQFSLQSLLLSMFFVPHARVNGEVVPMMKLGWTLNYEVFFYLVFASFAAFSGRGRAIIVTIVFFALVLLGTLTQSHGPIAFFYTHPVILSFCVGMWVGLIALRETDTMFRTGLWVPGSAAAASSLLLAGFFVRRGLPPNFINDLLFALAAGSLILMGLMLESRLPRWKSLLLIGDASYSIYLVHMYFVAANVLIFHRLFDSAPVELVIASTFVSALVGAVGVHLFVEKPIMQWFGKRRRSIAQ